MAITSTEVFTEVSDISSRREEALSAAVGVNYRGTLRDNPESDIGDTFSYTVAEGGYYLFSWEFSLPGVSIHFNMGTWSEDYHLHNTKVTGEILVPFQAGRNYTIELVEGHPETEILNYSFDLVLTDRRGTSANDIVHGNADGNRIYGFEGDDAVLGYAGHDSLYGGGGNDTLFGGTGSDYLYAGDDGGGGNDTLFGGIGSDYLYAGDGDNRLEGGNGRDHLFAGSGSDTLIGGRGADTFELSSATRQATVYGGAGRDELNLFSDETHDIKAWTGNAADDVAIVFGEDSHVVVDLGRGNDRGLVYARWEDGEYANVRHVEVFGQEGDDYIYGVGDIYGGAGSDTLSSASRGGDLANRLFGGAGDDVLDSARSETPSTDVFFGGYGNDSLSGGFGSETLHGGLGQDTFKGSTGRDLMVLGADEHRDVIFYKLGRESKPGFGVDRIKDFVSGIDVVDFFGVDADYTVKGNQILLYGGETALANGLWHQLVDGDTHVFLDVDADALADMQVILKGVTTVAEGDFIL